MFMIEVRDESIVLTDPDSDIFRDVVEISVGSLVDPSGDLADSDRALAMPSEGAGETVIGVEDWPRVHGIVSFVLHQNPEFRNALRDQGKAIMLDGLLLLGGVNPDDDERYRDIAKHPTDKTLATAMFLARLKGELTAARDK